MSRVALVTGASSGIGRAAAMRLAEDGMKIFATGRRTEALASLAIAQPNIRTHSADLASFGVLGQLLRSAAEAFGADPSVVLLAAGRGLRGGLLSSDPAQWEELIRVNQLSMMSQMRDAAEFLMTRSVPGQVADIVIIGSTVGRQVSAMNPVYGATKFAVHSLCESLRQELCGHGIRVTLIEPGFVKTNFQQTAGYDEGWFAALEAESGPFLQPEDIASTVSFVVSQPSHIHLDDIRIRPTRQKA
ncbi:SDR family NAD(P)-dependent oxidoreductase [Rhizobium leguminosarum bv. viciae]|uniref:SDR family NAD(P)-dependent oxidoreductase n=1 Tax=Rhizobium leguminosarum bv. viciae TaxID=387 RepID=A0A8I2KHA0_RHILV|nr:SDR family oxidoreductase [Rhizobium leguminosarum]MBY5420082.1 SDR family oxidoreductase [Rhizobium leguminosarum]MBY5427997.1 SDR family oxidoreductase [Rhizobium leguminosarum]MBY5793865.1 SDR family oxidoreductase [Rhizobium leguminosarum]MBY5827133.1 SDR family oxidoreductase [Rhizobium leguminosarum]NKL85480.1 SDR family NAD(P)-dependent oxidoreductase [Rhizobium leguminosarum bv. viciae]